MTVIDTMTERNASFARDHFSPNLKILPSLKTMVIGCVDPRVDPANVLGFNLGEAVVIRNVGGRITPSTLETLEMLSVVSQVSGGQLGPGWNLILLHHTDCGIKRLHGAPDLLGSYFGVAALDLAPLAIDDPHASVAFDIAALKTSPRVSGAFLVTGLVYDVATGLVEIVVPPGVLRP